MKYAKISNELFKSNRKNLINTIPAKSIVLSFAAYQMPRNGDQFFPYRQNSDFFYLTGIEQEKSILLLCNHPDAGDLTEVLFIIKPDKDLETWEGHKLTNEEATSVSGIKQVKFIEDFHFILHALMCISENIYFNIPEQAKFMPEVKTRDEDMLEELKKKYPSHNYKRLAPVMQKLRIKKSGQEIELIKKACTITHGALIRMMKALKPGLMEYEVEAEISYEFLRLGATTHAYQAIVASGKNACTLHYIENDQKCKDGDLLLLDFGAEYANYAADLSRTIPVNGIFSPRQKDLYNATLRVFKFARSLMIPGTTINKLHKEVCKMWQEEHIKLGLYTKSDVDKNKGINPLWYKYFMHGTGHFLGLDVHDTGTRDTVLEPGMILTCEPGLYIPEEKTGIRIENNILITEKGNVDLMADFPIEVEEIEDIMAEK
ncbi:MAG: aminopeptidase P N-terminal domain-containing protein [Bacteroidales bacterium]|nr:aminopeptidase P N-terminal domain-containing protein [Bacteroidales bacterium]MBN2817843.1 aminopeptidase P N-terminal domain-containing protein [Bacteroidales bacterium]